MAGPTVSSRDPPSRPAGIAGRVTLWFEAQACALAALNVNVAVVRSSTPNCGAPVTPAGAVAAGAAKPAASAAEAASATGFTWGFPLQLTVPNCRRSGMACSSDVVTGTTVT